MRVCCPNADCVSRKVVKRGYFITKWNAQPVPRYYCHGCRKSFSSHTFLDSYRQKKPYLNEPVFRWYSSGVTLRRMAKVLEVNRKTVVRKFRFLATQARRVHEAMLKSEALKDSVIQIDEMESFEHTRLKPLSIAMAVSEKGKLLSFQVASMNAKGKRAALSRRKYGVRKDTRRAAMREVLKAVSLSQNPNITILTDKKNDYRSLIKQELSQATHVATKRVFSRSLFQKGRRRNPNDKMFVLNYTAAKIRHDLSRMGRRVWVTTKKASQLQNHLDLYLAFHNQYSLPK